jgi:hypothetical protein
VGGRGSKGEGTPWEHSQARRCCSWIPGKTSACLGWLQNGQGSSEGLAPLSVHVPVGRVLGAEEQVVSNQRELSCSCVLFLFVF